jgi:S1-C subfamily serine protease
MKFLMSFLFMLGFPTAKKILVHRYFSLQLPMNPIFQTGSQPLLVMALFLICGAHPLVHSADESHGSSPNAKAEQRSSIKISTGFFVSDAGHIITALHAVEGYHDISVVLADKRRFPAKLLRTNKTADVALLKISAITPFIYLASNDNAPAGMEIATIGYSNVALQGLTPTISRGIITSARGLREDSGSFQFNADVARGNSGGPIISPNGIAVGMVRSKLVSMSDTATLPEPIVNLNFATSANSLVQLLKDIHGIPSSRAVDPDLPLKTVRIYTELKNAIVPVIAEGIKTGY